MLKVTRTVEFKKLRFPTVEVSLSVEHGELRFGFKTFTKEGDEFEISIGTGKWDKTDEEFYSGADEFFEVCPWDEGLEEQVREIQTKTVEEALELFSDYTQ